VLKLVGQVMSYTVLALRQRNRACRVQYESVEFVVVGSRQTATNAKMSRDVTYTLFRTCKSAVSVECPSSYLDWRREKLCDP